MYYADPATVFPVREFAAYLEGVLPYPPAEASVPEARRALASAALLTAYASASWQRSENHLCVAQAWLVCCVEILRFAVSRELKVAAWEPSYELAFEAARSSLARLALEAAEAPDLVIPDLADGVAYGSRALLVSGFLGAHLLSERTLGPVDDVLINHIRSVLVREREFLNIVGETDAPALFLTSAGLEQVGEILPAERLVIKYVRTLSIRNRPDAAEALADPYHGTEEVLLHTFGAPDTNLGNERFDGRSYTLLAGVEWLARRLWRRTLASMCPDITRIIFCETQPSQPLAYLASNDPDSVLRQSFPGQPQSWAALLSEARRRRDDELPPILWERREMLPYLPLLFPYRFTASLARAIDVIGSQG
jgi:hypothetical protein